MSFLDYLRVIFIGIVCGFTKWLPVSDNAHMMLVSGFFSESEALHTDLLSLVYAAAGFGAAIGLFLRFAHKLDPISQMKTETQRQNTRSLDGKILLSSLPFILISAIAELLLKEYVFRFAWNNYAISAVLFLSGILVLFMEKRNAKKDPAVMRFSELPFKTAFLIGLFGLSAVLPGSGLTEMLLLGGLVFSLSPYVSAELAFFSAIPASASVMVFRLIRFMAVDGAVLTGDIALLLLLSFVSALLLSIFVSRLFMRYLKRHPARGFAFYKIALGILTLVVSAVQSGGA